MALLYTQWANLSNHYRTQLTVCAHKSKTLKKMEPQSYLAQPELKTITHRITQEEDVEQVSNTSC